MNNNSELTAFDASRARRAASMKISLAVALFFSLAWALLQWSLLAGEQFADAGIARAFARAEAAVCAAAAIAAILHFAFNAVAAVVGARRHHAVSRPASRLPILG